MKNTHVRTSANRIILLLVALSADVAFGQTTFRAKRLLRDCRQDRPRVGSRWPTCPSHCPDPSPKGSRPSADYRTASTERANNEAQGQRGGSEMAEKVLSPERAELKGRQNMKAQHIKSTSAFALSCSLTAAMMLGIATSDARAQLALQARLASTNGRTEGAQTAAKPSPKPKPCLPEGKHTNDSGRCCSKSSQGNICCGVTHDSCAKSGCCDPAGDTPHCHEGSSVACFPEGAQGDAASCCIHVAENGLCCGESFGTCAKSGCCGEADTPICYEGSCVPCLPDGAAVTNGDETICCSGAVNDAGQCCGEAGATCAASLCCAAGATCDEALTCQPCLAEGQGSQTPDGADCCSGAANSAGQCCGEIGATCAASLCCADGANCNGETCQPCLAEGEDSFNFDGAECCSFAENSSGLCCGEVGASCAASLCCADGARCDGQTCQPCLAEGEVSQKLDGADCCSGSANDAGQCCGGVGDFCATSLCCANGAICDGQICFGCLVGGSATTHPTECCSGSAENGVCCGNLGATCSSDGDCCGGTCCNGVCTDTATDPSNCGGCANNCPTFFGGQGPNTCQNGICGHQCTWPINSPCPPPADMPFCQFFETCVQSCLINGRGEIVAPSYVICCGSNNCADQAPGTCGDGVCCCGGCNLGTLTCCASIGDSCSSDSDCCPGMVCDGAFGGCNLPN
jgi:hypothetical protein